MGGEEEGGLAGTLIGGSKHSRPSPVWEGQWRGREGGSTPPAWPRGVGRGNECKGGARVAAASPPSPCLPVADERVLHPALDHLRCVKGSTGGGYINRRIAHPGSRMAKGLSQHIIPSLCSPHLGERPCELQGGRATREQVRQVPSDGSDQNPKICAAIV